MQTGAQETVFDSSDSVRSGRPLRHAKSWACPEPLVLENGGVLKGLTVAYETYGQLNAARDNCILICHALSGDSHVARHDPQDEPGWWDLFVGPGKPVDTDRYFVVCQNVLGGCRGTTGPHCLNPDTGKPYGRDFPTVTIKDMVEVQRRLMDHLGVERLLAIIGGSLGGHQAMTWAIEYPDRVRGVVAVATSPRLTPQAMAFDIVARNAIIRDPHFHNGQYYGKPNGPSVGLALARMIGHITYLSSEAMNSKFDADRLSPRDVPIEFEKQFSVGSYLGYQGTRFVERFDANSYVVISMALDLFDLGADAAARARAYSRAKCRWLVLSFTSDWLFPPEQSRQIVDALLANKASVSYCNIQSSCGHDAFLLEDELERYGGMTAGFLAQLATATGGGAVADGPHGPTSIFQHRLDYDRIVELIPAGGSVLDLGCGSGGLLARLQQRGQGRLVGVELDEQNIQSCVSRGMDVVQADLNQGLVGFGAGEFDCVVLSQTLQAVYDVERVIDEMLRVGRTGIVSLPNLAYHRLRKMLAEEGRAPKSSGILSYDWFNTPNIRFCTIADFEEFCRSKQIRVHKRIAIDTESGGEVSDHPNLNSDLAIFVLSRDSQ